jgi:hypothetical protein
VYKKETWKDVAAKTKFSAFATARQEAFALLSYKNGYEAWSWMLSDTYSSSDQHGVEEAPTQPTSSTLQEQKTI